MFNIWVLPLHNNSCFLIFCILFFIFVLPFPLIFIIMHLFPNRILFLISFPSIQLIVSSPKYPYQFTFQIPFFSVLIHYKISFFHLWTHSQIFENNLLRISFSRLTFIVLLKFTYIFPLLTVYVSLFASHIFPFSPIS